MIFQQVTVKRVIPPKSAYYNFLIYGSKVFSIRKIVFKFKQKKISYKLAIVLLGSVTDSEEI